MFSPLRFRRPRANQTSKPTNRCRPRLEALEDRVAPAFDLALSGAATLNVTSNLSANVTTFTATGTGATLNVADVLAELNAGHDVVVNSGSAGTETGNISVSAALAYSGAAAQSLTLQSGTGTGLVGDVNLNAAITSTTTLNVEVDAQHDVNVSANLSAGTGQINVNAGADLSLGATLTAAAGATFSVGTATAAATTVTVTLTNGFGVTAGTDVSIVGRVGAHDTLHGPDVGTTFTLTGPGSGTVSNVNIHTPVAFSAFENLVGGAGNDRFVLGSSTASIDSIDGGAGVDTLDLGHTGAAINISGTSSSGFSGSVPGFVTSFTNIDTQGAIVFAIPAKHGAPDLPPDDDPEDVGDADETPFEHHNGLGHSGVVEERLLDLAGNPLGSWTVVAPGLFTKVVATPYGDAGGSMVFGLGVDRRIYAATVDAGGHLLFGWFLVAPGKFRDLAVTTFGADQAPIVFGLGHSNHQIFAATLKADGSALEHGWFLVAPGKFRSFVVTTYGANFDSPVVFAIGLNRRVFEAKLDDTGAFQMGWAQVAPGHFRQLTVAQHPDGSVELFGLANNHHVFAAEFDAAADLEFGWFLTAPGQFAAIQAAPLGAGDIGGVNLGIEALLLQPTTRPQYAAIFNEDGTLDQGWIRLTQGLFTDLGDTSAKTVLYAIGQNGKDNPNQDINFGFFTTPPGPFESIALSV